MLKLNLNSILGLFNKALAQLEQYVQQSQSEIKANEEKAARLVSKNNELQREQDRAANAIKKIKEITGE